MFPRLDTPAQVAEAIAHLSYPPQGDRGVAGYNRARRFGTDGLTAEQVNDKILGIVQIETLSALDNVEEIAAIPGVDVLFLDTGYHFVETIGTADAIEAVYPVTLRRLLPLQTVAEQDAEH